MSSRYKQEKVVPLVGLLAALVVAVGCSEVDCTCPGDKVFVNPDLHFPSSNVVEPGEGHPYPFKQFPYEDAGPRSLRQLEEFSVAVKERFSQSGLTESEAEQVYVILEGLGLQDGSYGRPSPDQPPPPPYEVRERIMIKKLDETAHEIFFDRIDCGRRYNHAFIVISGSQIVDFKYLERWSETYPC